jgi:hypothetical protein
VLIGRNGAWATLPGKPQVDKHGQPKRDANGKLACVAMLDWESRELRDRFSEEVVELVRARHPGDLE